MTTILPSINHIHIVNSDRELFANYVGCGLLEVGYKNLTDGTSTIRRYWKTSKGWEQLSAYHDIA
jgi:hypothetical protein